MFCYLWCSVVNLFNLSNLVIESFCLNETQLLKFDQKFCIFLHSANRKRTFHHNKNKEGNKHDYLNCLILEISPPIFDHDKDKDNSTNINHSSILSISIVSIYKFPFDGKLSFYDSLLL